MLRQSSCFNRPVIQRRIGCCPGAGRSLLPIPARSGGNDWTNASCSAGDEARTVVEEADRVLRRKRDCPPLRSLFPRADPRPRFRASDHKSWLLCCKSATKMVDPDLASWFIKAWFFAAGTNGPMDRVALTNHPSLSFFDAPELVATALKQGCLDRGQNVAVAGHREAWRVASTFYAHVR